MKLINMVKLLALLMAFHQFTDATAQDCVLLTAPGQEEPDFSYGDLSILQQYEPVGIRQIRIAAHVVRTNSGLNGISMSNLNTSIVQLNSAFAPYSIQFELAHIDTIDNSTYSNLSVEEFDGLTQINRISGMINVYYVPQSSDFNGIARTTANILAILNSAATNGSTLAHEVGHNLNLLHTHGFFSASSRQELVNGSNCSTAGDFLCDTPAEPFNGGFGISSFVYASCEYTGTFLDPNGQSFNPDTRNFMGYSKSSCRNRFSQHQTLKMHQTLATSLSSLIQVPFIVTNRIGGSNAGGTLTVGNQTLGSGSSLALLSGSSYDGKTNQERFGSYKHHHWNESGGQIRLQESFIVNRNEPYRNAYFQGLSPVTIQNLMPEGGSVSNIQFRDPWFLDAFETQPDQLHSFSSPHSPSGAFSQSSGGVFLGQDFNIPGNPHYSVRAPSSINFGGAIGTRPVVLINWMASPSNSATFLNAISPETPVVFNLANSTISANLKISRLTSLNTAFSNSSQRKMVRSTNGWNHMVYESMGHVWYEAKPASGNWSFILGMNGSLHLNSGSGKTPAIARTASTHPWGDMTLVAWQEANTIVMRIHYYSTASQSYVRAFPTLYTDIVMPSYYTLDVNPSIAWSDNGAFILVYHSPTGIQYELYDFEVGNTPSLISSGVVPGTDANSKNAAVSSFSYSVVDYTWFDIAWEQHGFSNGPIQSIRHSTLDYFEGVSSVSSPQTVSSSSVPKNSGISIVSLESGPMIGWISNATAGYTTSIPSNKASIRNPVNGVITTYDSYVRSVSVTSVDNLSTYYMGWSQILDQNPQYDTNRFIVGTAPTQVKILNTKGWHLQLMNGPTANDMRASAFFPKTVPYYFQETNTLGSYLKEAPVQTSISRGVSVHSGEGGVSLSLEKLSVASVPITFPEVDHEQLRFTTSRSEQVRVSRKQMNERVLTQLISEPFQLKSGDVVNLAEDLSLFGSVGGVSISVQLEPVGKSGVPLTLRTFNQSSTSLSRQALAFRVQGIIEGQYQLVIRVDAPDDAEMLLLEHIHSGDVNPDAELQTNEVIEIHSEQVTYAALHPNFPNPFNPSTMIGYQLPEAGSVSIQVFDVTGRLVATLVDGQVSAGRHQVRFDSGSLSSGV